jgi:hypothetical protein
MTAKFGKRALLTFSPSLKLTQCADGVQWSLSTRRTKNICIMILQTDLIGTPKALYNCMIAKFGKRAVFTSSPSLKLTRRAQGARCSILTRRTKSTCRKIMQTDLFGTPKSHITAKFGKRALFTFSSRLKLTRCVGGVQWIVST